MDPSYASSPTLDHKLMVETTVSQIKIGQDLSWSQNQFQERKRGEINTDNQIITILPCDCFN